MPSKLALYTPKPGDLWFRRQLMADPETMSYNDAWGGTIPFPEEEWAEWYGEWVTDESGERFYRYLAQADSGAFVGEAAYRYDDLEDKWLADVIVYAPFRSRGYGHEGLHLLCAAAKMNGVSELWDSIALDNPAIKLFLASGFTEEYRTPEAIYLRKLL